MTLLRAISLSGGLTSLANKDRVTIRRKVKGSTVAATVSVEDIIDNRIADVPLQAGDSIYVAQRFS
jgi:polysaccharide export outer membrane protein